MQPSTKSLIIEIAVALYVLLFLYTGLTKSLNYVSFVRSMLHVDLIKPFAQILGVLVPATEIIVAIALIFSKWRKKGLHAATTLMGAFTGYVGFILVTVPELPCTCGGIIDKMSWRQHLIFNIFFFIIGLLATSLSRERFVMINRRSRIPAN